MAAIGERGATATTVSDSDSDHEFPEKEPEFVIDIVDSLSQPLIHPRPQLMLQHPAEAALFPQQPQQFTPWLLPLLQQLDKQKLDTEYADMPKECTNCFICKIVHCVLVLVCVGVTLLMVRGLPGEYKEGNGALIFLCPIVIAVLAVHWLMLAKYDKEQC